MGGIKKPVNIFRMSTEGDPKGIYSSWRLWFAVMTFGLLGAGRGVDEGSITGIFNSVDFQNSIHYSSYSTQDKTNIKANISAMVQIGSVGGALLSVFILDRVGRLWATRILTLIWIVGISLFMGSNGSLGMVYAGRFIAGLGIGQTPVVGPIYIAEVAPASIRGLCTCIFTGFVYLGIVLGYFANYGASLNIGDTSHARWQVPASVHIIFAGLIFILTWFNSETPRYEVKSGRIDKAVQVMARLRNLPPDHEYVQHEIRNIINAHQEEKEATKGVGWFGVVKELFTIPSNLYRFFLIICAQILSQWSGAGSITLYAADLFSLLGVTGNNEGLLVTAVFGIVKLVAAITCAIFLVDYIGRKRSLMLGITLQAVAMVYIASFMTKVWQLGIVTGYKITEAEAGPSRGAIAMIYISGVGWALGWNSMQYLIGAEIFPLRIRALANSLGMAIHFANQYGNTRAVPNMLLSSAQGGLTPKGTFWFFAAVTVLGGLWAWFFLPETGGRDLESMDRLFALPWWKIGRYGNKDADELDEAHREMEQEKSVEAGEAGVKEVERVEQEKGEKGV